MDWSWLPTAVGVVLFLGAATVYLVGSKDKGTIATLKESNAALTERVDTLKAKSDAQALRIDALAEANRVLTNTVNSADLITALRADLEAHHVAAMEGLEQVHSDLAGLPTRFAAVMKGNH